MRARSRSPAQRERRGPTRDLSETRLFQRRDGGHFCYELQEGGRRLSRGGAATETCSMGTPFQQFYSERVAVSMDGFVGMRALSNTRSEGVNDP
jgi:hypothetical protein